MVGTAISVMPATRRAAGVMAPPSRSKPDESVQEGGRQDTGIGRGGCPVPSPCIPCPAMDAFRRFAHRCSTWVGTPSSFALALLVVVAWAVTGPAFHFSDTWQLVINTGTTVVTFLMVFLI